MLDEQPSAQMEQAGTELTREILTHVIINSHLSPQWKRSLVHYLPYR